MFNDRDVIVDLAPHYFDIVNYMLDAWPAKITCVAKPYRQKDNPEATYISCEMPNGAIAHAHLNWLSPKKVRSIELVGKEPLRRHRRRRSGGHDIRIGLHLQARGGKEQHHPDRTAPFHQVHLSTPMTETRNSGAIGVKTVEMIERAKDSLAQSRTVERGGLHGCQGPDAAVQRIPSGPPGSGRRLSTLHEAGHEVAVLCWNRGRRPRTTRMTGASPSRRVRTAKVEGTMALAANSPLFFIRAYLRSRRLDFDAVHCHDYDTLMLGAFISRLRGVPLVYDSHEWYAKMVEDDLPGPVCRLIERSEALLLANRQRHSRQRCHRRSPKGLRG